MSVLALVAAVSLWVTVLTVGGFVLFIAAVVWVQLWAQRRRRRGEEASTSEAEGAEAVLRHPGMNA
jgi:hypothetical protein